MIYLQMILRHSALVAIGLLTISAAQPSLSPQLITPPPISQRPLHSSPAPKFQQGAPLRTIYSSPGIATMQNGQWVGSEHIFNVSPHLALVVELVLPPGLTIAVTENSIRERMLPILQMAGLAPRSPLSGESPLPFFHMLIMMTPIEQGYAAYISGRLFEDVINERVQLKPSIKWQAITWEKQELLIFGATSVQQQLERSVQEITKAFADLYRSYQSHTVPKSKEIDIDLTPQP